LHWYLTKLPIAGRFALPVRQLEWSLRFHRAALEIHEEERFDVVETSEIGAYCLSRRASPPLVIRFHGSDFLFRKHAGQALGWGVRLNHRMERAAWKRARAWSSPSKFHATEIAVELGESVDRIRVIPNPIDSELLAAAAENTLNTTTGAPRLILYTGRLAPVKGTATLIEAARAVIAEFPDLKFVMAGPWQMPMSPESLGVTGRSLDENAPLVWLDHVPWSQLAEWYRRALVFVMPSYFETFGISCLEAMAFGVPVVATRAGALPEVVVEDVTGLLVPPREPAPLALALIRLVRDGELRRKMGKAGKERVLSNFTVDRMVEDAVRIYTDVAK
jgi:glycosyltransferase involved in cell wall biosynthesis